jgi:hypothetical protein
MISRAAEYWEDLKAWRRGEVRIAPHGTTGRVYARKDSRGHPIIPSKGTVRTHIKITSKDGRVREVTLPDKEI